MQRGMQQYNRFFITACIGLVLAFAFFGAMPAKVASGHQMAGMETAMECSDGGCAQTTDMCATHCLFSAASPSVQYIVLPLLLGIAAAATVVAAVWLVASMPRPHAQYIHTNTPHLLQIQKRE